MVEYEVRFNDGEVFAQTSSFEMAKEIRSENNFRFMRRSLHIYAVSFDEENGYSSKEII